MDRLTNAMAGRGMIDSVRVQPYSPAAFPPEPMRDLVVGAAAGLRLVLHQAVEARK